MDRRLAAVFVADVADIVPTIFGLTSVIMCTAPKIRLRVSIHRRWPAPGRSATVDGLRESLNYRRDPLFIPYAYCICYVLSK